MKWGIAFNVPATYESDLWGLPPPSQIERVYRNDGTNMIRVLYHFLHSPQSRKEWQRVAGIKVQITNRVQGVELQEYEPLGVDGKVYTISELGKHFKEFVKFPAPFFDGTPQAILARHAKRLHYEGLLHIEQLIFVSMWVKEIAPKNEIGRRKKDEGIRQVMRRAVSAYKFALDHQEDWKVKLSAEKRHEVLSQSASKSAQVRKEQSQKKRERAKLLRAGGMTFPLIAKELGISLITAKRWNKT